MAKGGYRQPTNPAPVSGPGALSRRTDGKQPVRVPTGLPYGEAGQMAQAQQAFPLAQSDGGNVAAPAGAGQEPPLVPFGAGTQSPDVPVTAGAAAGAGPGPEALGLPQQPDEDMKALLPYLPVFEFMANQPGSSRAARNLVRSLKGML